MPNYEKMYAILCGAISDVLDETLPIRVQMILQNAILATEEIYVSNIS